MRDPINIKDVDYNGENISVIKIKNLPDFDMQDWDLDDPKEQKKYILNLKRIIRNSFEYKQMVRYLKENLNMNYCSFFKNVSNIDNYKIKIHIHHEPFTLEEICEIVFKKRCYYNENLDENMVAKEVMFLHYKLLIGLIPLSETIHSLVHNSYLFIPLDKIFGNFYKFYQMYKDFLDPEQEDILERCVKYTKEYNKSISDLDVLKKHYRYIDTSDVFDFPKLKEVVDLMNSKITEIKNKNSDKRNILIYPFIRDK